jgi:hypothetical protein
LNKYSCYITHKTNVWRKTMAIGRISGQMLKSNLLRSGTDLAFETTLLVLDVTNSRVGVGTASPATTFHISATDALRLPSGNDSQRPGTPANGDIRYNSEQSRIEGYSNGAWANMASGSKIQDADGNTGVDVERSADQNEIHFFTETSGDVMHIRDNGDVEFGGLLFDLSGVAITSTTTNGNIAITPNGTGEVDISKVDIAAGEIDGTTIGANSAAAGTFTTLSSTGNTTLGDASGDTVTFNADAWTLANGTTVTGTWTDLGTVTTVDINGGTMDAVNIGASSAATGLTVSGGTVSITDTGGDGTMDGVIIGGSTAAAGTFTTVTTTGNATIGGNLTVNGTTTTIDSTTLVIEDPLIQLAKNNSGGAANTFDQGLFFNRGSDDNVSFIWDESADQFAFAVTSGEDGTTAGNVTIDSYANLKANVGTFADVETGTVSAADGTESATIANSTGVMTIASSVLTTTDINGGSIDGVTIGSNSAATALVANGGINIDDDGDGAMDGVVIGANTAAAGTFTTGTFTTVALDGMSLSDSTITGTRSNENIEITPAGTGSVVISKADINSGAIDGTAIGANSASSGSFTTLNTSGEVVFNDAGAAVDFRIEGDTDTDLFVVDGSADQIGISTAAGSIGYVLDASGSTDAFRLPSGNTAARPTAATGIIRFNSQTGKYEGCADGSTYVEFATAGDTPVISKVSATGDGSSTTFTGFFGSAPAGVANVLVFIDNVYQEPTENYSISSNNITFTSAPHSGARIFAIVGFDNTALASGGVARSETSAVNFTSSATTLMSFNATTYRAAEAFIITTDSANTEYEVAKALIVHDGTTAYVTVYGQTSSTGSNLSTYSATLSGGSVLLQAVSSGGQQSAKVQYSLSGV